MPGVTRRALTFTIGESNRALGTGCFVAARPPGAGIEPRPNPQGVTMSIKWKETGGTWEPDHTLLGGPMKNTAFLAAALLAAVAGPSFAKKPGSPVGPVNPGPVNTAD